MGGGGRLAMLCVTQSAPHGRGVQINWFDKENYSREVLVCEGN